MAGEVNRSGAVFRNFPEAGFAAFCAGFGVRKKVVSGFRPAQSNAGDGGIDAARNSGWRFDTVRKRLLHSKGSHWTRVALVVRTLGLFRFRRQAGPTTTLDLFRQSVEHPHPSRTASCARY